MGSAIHLTPQELDWIIHRETGHCSSSRGEAGRERQSGRAEEGGEGQEGGDWG